MRHVCLLVPPGDWDVRPIVEAVRTHRPADVIGAVWCGDPQRRPTIDESLGVWWCDLGLDEPNGFGWGRLLVALEVEAYAWSRAACAVRRLLDRGADSVVVLRVGSAAVLGDVAALVPTGIALVVPRAPTTLPVDGFAPSEGDVIANGAFSTAIAAFAPGAQAMLADLENHAITHEGAFGPLFERVLAAHDADVCDPAVALVAGWGDAAPTVAPAVIDLDALDRHQPWHFSFGSRPSACAPVESIVARDRCRSSAAADRGNAVRAVAARWHQCRPLDAGPRSPGAPRPPVAWWRAAAGAVRGARLGVRRVARNTFARLGARTSVATGGSCASTWA